MSERRFPPPWSVEELDECFVVTDSTRLGTYCSNCNVTLTARDRLKPSKNPNSQEGTITT